ncbi:MAG: hypothetical protein ACYC8V_14310 [Caulobacteraceae bacterium]
MKAEIVSLLAGAALLAGQSNAQALDLRTQKATECQAQWRDMVAARATVGELYKPFMRRCMAQHAAAEHAADPAPGGVPQIALVGAAAAGLTGIAVAASQKQTPASP